MAEQNKYNELVLESMHELRYFNQRLKNLSEQLTKQLNIHQIGQDKPINIKSTHADQARVVAEGILNLSQLFTTRLDFIDVELNPNIVEQLDINEVSIYGKFDKARKMLNSISRGRRVKVSLIADGKEKRAINAYSIIDIMPYLILDNAIKYSPCDYEVSIDFQYYSSSIEIRIESFGPFVCSDEISKITDKHYRGKNAIKKEGIVGRGIGLYFVKYICDLHDIVVSFNSDDKTTDIDGIPYSTFLVSLSIPWNR